MSTNDLDVDTLRALEEAILNYVGCVVVISHDRWFLNRLCSHLLIFEGDGRVRFFAGNFAEYEEQVKAGTLKDYHGGLGEQNETFRRFAF